MSDPARESEVAIDGLARTLAGPETDLADLAAESVIVCDLDGIVQYWNPASEALYGWPAMGMIGSRLGAIAQQRSRHDEQWRLLLRDGSWNGQARRRALSGGEVVSSVRRIVRRLPSGEMRDVVEFGQRLDLQVGSERPADRAEKLPASAAFWEFDVTRVRPRVIDLAKRTGQPGADVFAGDPEKAREFLSAILIVGVNERTLRLAGDYSGRSGLIGQAVSDFWPRESEVDIAELIVSVVGAWPHHTAQTRKIASPLLEDCSVTVWSRDMPGQAGKVFVAVNGEVSGDNSFLYLRASEDRYRKLIQHLPVAVLQVDARRAGEAFGELRAKGITDFAAYLEAHPELVDFANDAVKVTEVNQEAVTLFAASTAADLAGPVRFLFASSPGTDRRVMMARFHGKRNYSEIAKIRTLDGRLRDVQLSVTYPAPPERLDVTIICIQDITERLRTERQLRQLQAENTHAARISMLGELTSSIAHEVNQPLAAIVTNAETSLRWLSREEPNIDKVRLLTTRIAGSARRASDIVGRIRGMASKHEPEHVALDLNEIIDEAILFIRYDIEARSIDLSVAYGCELPRIVGDRVQLQQVIINLLVNSIQAMKQDQTMLQRIEITTSVGTDECVVLAIRDSGPGIEGPDIERIFDSFFTTKDAGMGIGLAICRSIVVSHGGSISARNHPGGGAEFRVVLPTGSVDR
ncbi:PAS domain-containing sensor histidine kinase [Hyphomonas johnsonii]|uniref:histidine kinase n=1 Tax=Hyphomonas johnsonii MHS-2 TaxID=1280950 RepID=A0A059FUI1_9PROT|nr:ATP-binding protein [Hyphomonas johnsonii]KCZ94083.1 two-component system sensor histidine kinase [Hyphomonas johnsonii MHS-2]